MKRLIASLLLALLVVSVLTVPAPASASHGDAGQATCEFPFSATDVTGTNVSLAEAPERIVTLQPSGAQTMWEIGARDQVVGLPINQYTDYLDDRDGRTNVVNDDGTTNVEAVAGTNPDLVLAANTTSVDTVDQLRTAGLTVYHFDLATSLDDIVDQTETAGRLTGNCEGANETVTEMEERIQRVSDAVADREEPRVLYYFFQYTTGSGTHIHDLIQTAGGSNVAVAAGLSGYQPISAEVVAERDPEWIVQPSHAPRPSGPEFNGTTAFQQDQVLSVDANYVSQPAPRVVIALEAMATAFHPDAFTNETVSTETADGSPTGQPAETVTETTITEGTGPGVGIVGTVAVLLGTLALGARRKDT